VRGEEGWPNSNTSNTMWPRLRPAFVPSDILIHQAVCHNKHGSKSGAAPFLGGAGSPIQHHVACTEAYLHTKWHLDLSIRLATTDMGRKLGAVPLCGGSGSPSNTSGLGRGLPPYQGWHPNPSNRLATMHQRRRQIGQDRTDRQWSYKIERTVLQTVAQKLVSV